MFRKSTVLAVLLVLPLLVTQVALAASGPNAVLIFADGFESGNFSAWSYAQKDAGDLLVTVPAAMEGNLGMRALIDDNTPIFVRDDTPNAEFSYKAKFFFDPNSIAMGNGDLHTIFMGQDLAIGYQAVLRVEFRFMNGSYYLRSGARRDDMSWNSTIWFPITDQSHEIEVEWDASEGAGLNNGQMKLYIDSVLKGNRPGIDNDTFRIDRARLGAVANIDTTTRGRYFMDGFESYE